jgi:Lrp/AsnC family leucine-responsive transcriptional regulator
MMEIKLKPEDKKLLNLIQGEDACVPRVTKIAHKLGLPTSTVKTKIDKFKKLGVIKGFSAILDPVKVDRGFVAFKFGAKKFKQPTDLDEIGRKLAKIPEVEEVYFLVGEWDYAVKMRLKDKLEYVKVAPQVAVLVDRCKGVIAPKMFKETHKILVK